MRSRSITPPPAANHVAIQRLEDNANRNTNLLLFDAGLVGPMSGSLLILRHRLYHYNILGDLWLYEVARQVIILFLSISVHADICAVDLTYLHSDSVC